MLAATQMATNVLRGATEGRRRILRRQAGSMDGLPVKLHPVLRRVYAARGLVDGTSLGRGLTDLLPVSLLDGADGAAALLQRVIEQGGRILLLGDFDADGATSCALGLMALRAMGATRVDYLVPNRFDYGYGLTPEILEVALGLCADVIVTVDNGVSSVEGVAAANQAGVPVIITDHHLPGARLPEAAAIVNPNLSGNGFPSKSLAGVGVIFYVMAVLRARLRDSGWLRRQGLTVPALADLLDLVALGTVADLVPLDANNRILVDQGLRRIRAGKARPGLLALLEVARRDRTDLQAADLAFAVAPRLNAAGRLEDMSLGIECLLCEDPPDRGTGVGPAAGRSQPRATRDRGADAPPGRGVSGDAAPGRRAGSALRAVSL
jgi:single-stranded-DNA-specific exonuclease